MVAGPGQVPRAGADVHSDDVGGNRPELDRNPRAAIILGGEFQAITASRRRANPPDGTRIAGKEIGGWTGGTGGYQPRWIHSSR